MLELSGNVAFERKVLKKLYSWSQHSRKMGKLYLVGDCSIIAVFDGSAGSVSSLWSLYSQVRQG